MSADEHGVSFTVTNTGTVAGSEVAQIYISKTDSAIFRPIKELKAFVRVTLAPGEKQRVSILLDDKAFRFWNVKSNFQIKKPHQGTPGDSIGRPFPVLLCYTEL